MAKAFVGVLLAGVMSLLAGSVVQRGCRDATRSLTHLEYYPIRDMRRTVVLNPHKHAPLPPDPVSVPTQGIERTYGLIGAELAERKGGELTNPIAADDSSRARGQRKFEGLCAPCHGRSMAGDGPVASMFMPPPDLLAEATRNRRDGFLYSYIRHGGVMMPSYGMQLSAAEAWEVVNYVRHMQRTSPR